MKKPANRIVEVDEVSEKEKEEERTFQRAVERRQARMRRARREGVRTIWAGLGAFGLVGWTIAVPVVLGTLAGVWLDRITGGGVRWTLGLMLLGLIIGGTNAWTWIERERHEEEEP